MAQRRALSYHVARFSSAPPGVQRRLRMSVATNNEARQRVVRWLEEGQRQLSAVLAILHDYDRVQGAAQMAEQECERLRAFVYENERLRNQIEGLESECGKLREEIQNLRGLG